MKLVNQVIDTVLAGWLAIGLVLTAICIMCFLDKLCISSHATSLGPTITHLIALVIGGLFLRLWQIGREREHRRSLPPATARQIARARRANRLEAREPLPRWIPESTDRFADDEVA